MRTGSSITRRQFAISSTASAAVFGAAPLAAAAQARRTRLRRSESYFGLHFDLHPNEQDTVLGRDVTDEMVGSLLDAVRPDYVQYDAKGHPGWLGWPSQVGPSAPGIVHDSLAIWRQATASRGVALCIHFSGVWDFEACKRHPEWARVGPDGVRDTQQTSTFGPYVDQLMLRQLREAASKYDLDGAWVDGECWATKPDYYPGVEAAFRSATGIERLPRGPQDPGWLQFLEFNRQQFRGYVQHYVEELHRTHPSFQVASNWLYSTFVPEEPTLPVDFLSGDFIGNACISAARLEARYFAQTGRSWDLLAWGFQGNGSNTIGSVPKPALQLQQEAAVVVAQGGGFGVYYNPSRAGWIEPAHVEVMRRVGRFCRERQQVSHKSRTVPQIGVVLSKETLYSTEGKLFGWWGAAMDPARGWIDALIALRYSVDVLPDWKLARIVRDYPLTVLPEWTAVGEEVQRILLDYTAGGGVLVVSGVENAALFAAAAGIRLHGGKPSQQNAWVSGSEVLANLRGLWQDVDAGAGTVLERRFPDYDTRSGGQAAALAHQYGKGEIVVVPGPLGAVYAQTHAPAVRDFVWRLIGTRFQPLVGVTAPPTVEVVLRRQDGRLAVHLLNSAGMQVAGDYAAIDFIPEVGPIRLTLPWKPRRIEVTPGGALLQPVETLTPKQQIRAWVVELPKLHVHTIVTLEPPADGMI
jgi:hypothetical protein